MLRAMAFRASKDGVKHIAAGRFDDIPSLCGSVTYNSLNPKMSMVGDKMDLDRLIHAQQGFCQRCFAVAMKEIESAQAYLRR